MPGCDIDWEDGWEFMQDNIVIGNTFESYNGIIVCAGNNFLFTENKFNYYNSRCKYNSFIKTNINN